MTPATRAAASPGIGGASATAELAVVPTAALAPADPDDAVVDRVGLWSTWGADRHRLRDRLRELRIAPWADATGDGATLRLAAARAALARLAECTPEWDDRAPADLTVATGGAWAVAAAPTIALALVDVLRRSGAGQFALDHARILAPLGSIPDSDERRAMVADLVDDLLAPLGTVVTPAGMRTGRSAGSVVVHGATGEVRLDLTPGRTGPGRPAARVVGRGRVHLPRHGQARCPRPSLRDRGDRRPRRAGGRPARRPAAAARPGRPARGDARVVAGDAA